MHPKGKRLEPLGASDDSTEESLSKRECQHCTCLEEEHELLQTSLFALTTHFAQVQFRLRQVCDAPFEDQEELLRSLERFAFADVTLQGVGPFEDDLMDVVKKWRHQQKLLLNTLKSQVSQLKNFEAASRREESSVDLLLDHLSAKEDVERQLRTQIGDLERFIDQLKSVGDTKCLCCRRSERTLRNHVADVLDRGFSFLQMFFMVQFTWGCSCFTVRAGITHWGDLRARLEVAVLNLRQMLQSKEDPKQITLTVRRSLATSVRDLMQHGAKSPQTHHTWDVISYYYDLRRGDAFNSSAMQKLSRSFNLQIAGCSPKKNRRNVLFTIGHIVATFSRYKRSKDAHFKAFICAALNANRLVTWLNMIFYSGEVIKNFYHPWSYVACTRCEDGLRSLNVLTKYQFELPVDLDVHKFQIEDTVFV